MLILFDIDATLITTSRSGILAMQDAGRGLYGPGFSTDGVEFAGRLDPLIIHDLLVANRIPVTPAATVAFRRGYHDRLAPRLSVPSVARALPGVVPLLSRLRAVPDLTLGLLTGNFPETGVMKLRACGLDPGHFTIQVWGDESPHSPPKREHLPAIGIARYKVHHAREVHPSRVTIIGDTPHDVACARASDCRVLGVATGSYSADDLLRAGADLVLPDLSDTARVVRWLLQDRANPAAAHDPSEQ